MLWEFWPTPNIAAASPIFFFEKYIIHPFDGGIRISLVAVYITSIFSPVSHATQFAHSDVYHTRFWSGNKTVRVRTDDRGMPDSRAGSEDCLKADMAYKRRNFFTYGNLKLPMENDRGLRGKLVTLEFRDDITISWLKEAGPALLGKRVNFGHNGGLMVDLSRERRKYSGRMVGGENIVLLPLGYLS